MLVLKSDSFDRWLTRLKDRAPIARVLARIDRLTRGNPGDVRSVGSGVFELRIDHGPGYRVYYVQRGKTTVLLLAGGDKSTQSNDIAKAKQIADEWRQTNDEHN